MDFESLQIFLEIYNTQSISGAAYALFLSQPTVSRKLGALEEYLGVQLFVRGKGRGQVYPTTSGKQFAKIARAMLSLQNEAMGLKRFPHQFQFRIAVIDSVSIYILTPFFQKLIEGWPHMECTIFHHHSYEIFNQLETRNVDIGIANSEAPHGDLQSEILFQEDFVIVHRNPDWPPYLTPSSLNPAHEIHQRFGPEFDRWHSYWWQPWQAKARVNITSQVLQFLTDEDDWAILPTSIAYTFQKQGFLVSSLSDPPPKRKVWLITHRDSYSYNHPIVESFCQQVREYITEFFEQLKGFPYGAEADLSHIPSMPIILPPTPGNSRS